MKDIYFRMKLEALITERESKIAFNLQRQMDRLSMGYDESSFLCLAESINDLIKEYEASKRED